jgi:hypothetical protein
MSFLAIRPGQCPTPNDPPRNNDGRTPNDETARVGLFFVILNL